VFFFFQAEDGIRDLTVTGVQTCALPILTLLAMVLAIGLVVDDAIVVVENIHRHLEEGMPPVQASLKGAREIVGPVVSMTITLARSEERRVGKEGRDRGWQDQ